MSETVYLYHNASNPHVFDKVLSGATEVTCDFKNPVDVENPVVYINASGDYATYNYMYIPSFGRYYDCKAVGGTSHTVTFECTSDPLMSFKTQIRAAKATIARNPWNYDLYVPDPNLPIESRTLKATFKFPNNHFSGTNNSYILTTLGSGSST